MVTILSEPSYSLNQFNIVPGWTPKEVNYRDVDLSVRIADAATLRYPLIAAGMGCVTACYEMVYECARNGLMAVLAPSMSLESQVGIITKLKAEELRKGDLELHDNPQMLDVDGTLLDAMNAYDDFGHSTIPIVDQFRRLHGVFRYLGQPKGDTSLTLREVLQNEHPEFAESVISFDREKATPGKDYFSARDSRATILRKMTDDGIKYVPIVDSDNILKRIAFLYQFDGFAVGAAIHTHPGWEDRAREINNAGVNVVFTDTSDVKNENIQEVVRKYVRKFSKAPLITGNGVDAEGYQKLCAEVNAAGFKAGMGSGDSCVTTDERGVGVGNYTALKNVAEAAKDDDTTLIGDGGIGTRRVRAVNDGENTYRWIKHDSSSIGKALAFVDAVMMGTGFNIMKEASGDTKEFQGEEFNGRWGEGSDKAASLARYDVGEDVRRARVAEGVSDYVRVEGRLKPLVERIGLQLAMTLANVGAKDLEEYREIVVLQRAA